MFPNTVVCFEIDSADVVVMSMNDEGCKTAMFCSVSAVLQVSTYWLRSHSLHVVTTWPELEAGGGVKAAASQLCSNFQFSSYFFI